MTRVAKVVGPLLLFCAAGLVRAEGATPKEALKSFDQVGTDPGVDRATAFYYAKTDDEKKVAKAFASVDLALAKLRKTAAARWDDKAGDAMVHAMRDVTADDIDAARESVDGDKATVTGHGFEEPLPMRRVDGTWKISIPDALKESNAKPDDLVKMCDLLVGVVDRTLDEIAANKYANPSLLERAVKRRVRAILGGE